MEHVRKKMIELALKQVYWLLGWNFQFSIPSKIMIYNQILKLVWLTESNCGDVPRKQTLGVSKLSRIECYGTSLRPPWYIIISNLRRDIKIPVVASEIKRFAAKHESRMHHVNVEALQLLNNKIYWKGWRDPNPLN